MTRAPSVRWRSFSLPKEGNTPEEYEDAFAGNPKAGRFAIADGASESSFASLWAQLLVDGFVASRKGRSAESWFTPLQQRWAEAVDNIELDWFGEEKRQLGAFATFLGLSLKKPQGAREGRWKAVALGDTCIFQVRDDQLLAAFPVCRSDDFSNRPPLVCSRPVGKMQGDPWSQVKKRIGRWKAGDRFFLMSDALAHWFLARLEEQEKPWRAFLTRMAEPNPTTVLTGFVEELRRQSELKNDDTTLVVVEL
jgi:hypothetical protein